MVAIERRIGGLLRYRKIWFADYQQAGEISRSLGRTDVVRFFAAPGDLSALPNIVKHRQLQTAWIDLSAGPESVLSGMKKKSCRYEIRRAEKMLARVDIDMNSPKALGDFLALYNEFAGVKRLPGLPASWLREYSANGEVFVLYLEKVPLCGHLVLRDTERRVVRLIYSASRRLQTTGDASACGALNRYLHWYEMQRYHAQGFATFDFGGIRDSNDPISRFKLSFGGAVVAEHYYLFSGSQWIARLGNLAYERILRRSVLKAKNNCNDRVCQ